MTRDFLAGCSLGDPVPCPSLALLGKAPLPGHGVLHVASYEESKPEIYEKTRAAAERYAAKTGREFREINNRIRSDSRQDLEELIQIYMNSDVIVSARLHGCIIGLALGRRVVAVSCDRKIESFMKMAGLEDWVLDYSAVDELPERLVELERQKTVSGFLEQSVSENRKVAVRVFELCGR